MSASGQILLSLDTMMRRLGLRCAEVAALEQGVDWPSGTLVIHGKGRRIDRMPLPVDAGQVLVDYLRSGRSDTPARAVFVRANAPAVHRVEVQQRQLHRGPGR